MKKIITLIVVIAVTLVFWFGGKKEMPAEKNIKVYMSYTYPIDPVFVKVLGDIDISNALSSQLLKYDQDVSGQVTSGLAKSWSFPNNKSIKFEIDPNAKWSDGAPISAHQIQDSLEEVKSRLNVSDGLFQQIASIQALNEKTLLFELKSPAKDSSVLMRLCEPTYGIVKLVDKKVDLTVSSGPFVIESQSQNELALIKNKYWLGNQGLLADKVFIRQKIDQTDDSILKEKWANIVHSDSLKSQDTIKMYEDMGLKLWNWKSHRTLFGVASHKGNENKKLLQYIRQKLNATTLTDNLAGFELGNQLYPPGYLLNKRDFSCTEDVSSLPDLYKTKPIRVLLSPERINLVLKKNLVNALREITNVEPQIIEAPAKNIFAKIKEGDFDFYFGTIAISNPNPDGSMDYLFRNKLIPSGVAETNFIERLNNTLKLTSESEQVSEYRDILETATCQGYITPLLYFNTTSIADAKMDLSGVKDTDETVEFAKVRLY